MEREFLDGMDHDKLDELAQKASVAKAKLLGLQTGDELAIGDSAYRIVELTESKVVARAIAVHGQSRLPDVRVLLDLRLSGWTVISHPDRVLTTLRPIS